MRRIGNILIWILPLVIAVAGGLSQKRAERSLFPGFLAQSYGYGDAEQGGRSMTRLEMRNGTLRAILDLEPGHPTPFTGFGFWLTDPVHPQGIDLTPYDRFEIEMRSSTMNGVGYNLVTWIPGFTTLEKPLSGQYLEGASNVGPVYTKFSVPFSVFSTASWWPQAAGIPANSAPVRMDLVKNFEIREPVAIRAPRHDTLEIRSIKVVGNNWTPLLLLLGIAIAFDLAHYILLRRAMRSIRVEGIELKAAQPPPVHGPGRATPVIGTQPEKIELANRKDLELQALLHWIGKNYHKESIGVEDASRETGIPVRKIPQLLKEHAGKSFPAFVASLRIAEARRLLRETDRQVTEIAMAVGFSNASHFHRVFKTETGEAPSAWREKTGTAPASPDAT